MKPHSPLCALTMAGSDPCGGAGLQADLRVMAAHGVHGCSVVTSLTIQGPCGVRASHPVEAALVGSQLETLFEEVSPAAAKTGLLCNARQIQEIARLLGTRPSLPLVVDPVLSSSNGHPLLEADALEVLKTELFPLATLITPNLGELALLTGQGIHDSNSLQEASLLLAQHSGAAVLAKGGHAEGDRCDDLLVTPKGRLRIFEGRRVRTRNTHGTGCSLSAAITALLARGCPLEDACLQAKSGLAAALQRGGSSTWGRGRGPAWPV